MNIYLEYHQNEFKLWKYTEQDLYLENDTKILSNKYINPISIYIVMSHTLDMTSPHNFTVKNFPKNQQYSVL